MRLANKASVAVHEIQGNGGRDGTERSQRTERENRESRWRHEEAVSRLLDRSVTFLHFVLFDGSGLAAEMGSLQNLASNDQDGFLQIEIPEMVRSRSGILVRGLRA